MRDTVCISEFSQFENYWRNEEGTGLGRAERGSTHQATFRVLFMHSGVFTSQPGEGKFSPFYRLGTQRFRVQGDLFSAVALRGGVVNLCHRTHHVPTCWGQCGDLSYAVFKTLFACCLTGPWPPCRGEWSMFIVGWIMGEMREGLQSWGLGLDRVQGYREPSSRWRVICKLALYYL